MPSRQGLRGAWHWLPRPLLLALLVSPAQAEITLRPPIDCDLGPGCHIQNHVDHDPGPGFRDFACGHLGYDGHTGTDFALDTLARMRAGVAVLAPAAGVVRAIRDGMPDIAANVPSAPALAGRDCGNAVIIDHAAGYSSQLCHLARDSVAVRPGERLRAGQPVGRVGLSGQTEFPHVHMTLRHRNRVIDPFNPDPGAAACAPGAGLWDPPLAYAPALLTGFGITAHPPSHADVLDSPPDAAVLPMDAPILTLWATILGPAAGDRLTLQLTGPQGSVLNHTETLTRNQARAFRFAGHRRPATSWPAGSYTATAELHRDGRLLHRARHTVTLATLP